MFRKIISVLQSLFGKKAGLSRKQLENINIVLDTLEFLKPDTQPTESHPVEPVKDKEVTKPVAVVDTPSNETVSNYFKPSEFVSKNDKFMSEDKLTMCPVFLLLLNKARQIDGQPWKVTSGQRSVEYNKEVGGVAGSSHTKGCAADISATSGKRKYEIVRAAVLAGFTRIGIGKNFIHLDTDTAKSSPTIWLY